MPVTGVRGSRSIAESKLRQKPQSPMFYGAPPAWAMSRPKPLWQSFYDLAGAPLRMVLLPDHVSERLHLTSLRAERLEAVLAEIDGRLLDIGAGDNMLVRLHREASAGRNAAAGSSVGVDVFDWGGGCVIVEHCGKLPFDDGAFDSVSFVACLNHIPERREALREACRVLRPGGKLVVTMIGKLLGAVGHAIWWYSEDKHRESRPGELDGMDPVDVISLIREGGFSEVKLKRFVYGLNVLYTARKPGGSG